MNGSVATIRELSIEEIGLVSGAFTWQGLGGAMLAGGIVGGLGAAATGAGIVPGMLAGGLLAGAGYLINDLFVRCF